jgi:hypothetical protein
MGQHRKVALQLACSATQASFEYCIPGDVEWLAEHWNRQKTVTCPHCSGDHSFGIKDAYLSAAVGPAVRLQDLIG